MDVAFDDGSPCRAEVVAVVLKLDDGDGEGDADPADCE